MEQKIKILSTEHLTHDVIRLRTEKPENFIYTPGQAADLSIDKHGWENEKRCFTFTSLPSDDHLEFVIKTYPECKSVTALLAEMRAGHGLLLDEPFGDIAYKGEGLFIAGGAGITPFLAILRHLQQQGNADNNRLIFANKTTADIILKNEFEQMLGSNFINVLSDEAVQGCEHGFISEEIIKNNLLHNDQVYVCGPPPMMDAVDNILHALRVNPHMVIKEGY